MRALRVSSDHPAVADALSRIQPAPAALPHGQHILFFRDGEADPVAWLQAVPCIWLGGELQAIKQSHWLYLARYVGFTVHNGAAAMRAWHALPEFPGLYPLTYVTFPANDDARAWLQRIGFAPDRWLALPGLLTRHALTPRCALFARHSRMRDQAL